MPSLCLAREPLETPSCCTKHAAIVKRKLSTEVRDSGAAIRAAAHAAMKLILIYCNNTARSETCWREVVLSRIPEEAHFKPASGLLLQSSKNV